MFSFLMLAPSGFFFGWIFSLALIGWCFVGPIHPRASRFLGALIVAVGLLQVMVHAKPPFKPSVAMLNTCDVWGGGWVQWACELLSI